MLANVYGLRLLGDRRVQHAAFLVVVASVLTFRLAQFLVFSTQVQWGYDFSFYWTAGGHLLHGQPIYSPQQLSGPYAPQGQEGFLYPPPFAAAMVAFAALFPSDHRAAMWIWAALGAVVLVASVLAVARIERPALEARFPILTGRGRWLLVAAAFAMPPVIGELVMGNVHILLLGLFSLAWVGVRRGDERGDAMAGVAVGVAAVIKLFPAVVLLWFLATRRWRAAAWTVVGAMALVVATLPITGLDAWRDFPIALANLSAPADATDALAPTVWLAPAVGFTVARIVVSVVGAVLVIWSARARPLAASFGLAVVVSLLVAPALYHHYLSILVLPLILAVAVGTPFPLLAAAYLLTFGGEQSALGPYAWIVLRGLPTLATLLLVAAFLVARRQTIVSPATAPSTV